MACQLLTAEGVCLLRRSENVREGEGMFCKEALFYPKVHTEIGKGSTMPWLFQREVAIEVRSRAARLLERVCGFDMLPTSSADFFRHALKIARPQKASENWT